jgi:hypothetical protein
MNDKSNMKTELEQLIEEESKYIAEWSKRERNDNTNLTTPIFKSPMTKEEILEKQQAIISITNRLMEIANKYS